MLRRSSTSQRSAVGRSRPRRPEGRVRQLSDWLVYVAVRVLICLLQIVGIEIFSRATPFLIWLGYDRFRIRRRVTDENLRHAFPERSAGEREALARGMWRHLLLMVCELALLERKVHQTNWRRYVHCRDEKTQVEWLLSERPVVMVSGHLGNFEVGGILAGLLGFPTYTIARPLDNRYLHRFITRHRSAQGQFILPKTGSARMAEQVLGSGGTLVLLGDQYAGPKGCWVEFFHRPASYHKAIALFALAHQAPLVLTYAIRLRRPMQFEVGIGGVFDPRDHPRANVREITAWYNQGLERLVREHPEQYWWVHRRWKT